LGNVDLTDGGVLNAFLLSVLSSDLGFTATFDIYDSVTDAAPSSTLSQDFGPVPFGSGPVAYTMLFSSFTDPAILTSADKIVLTLTGPAETDVTLDFIQAVPEPASVGLMLASLPGVVVFARRRRRLLSPR
jgi:hypothetical protein